MAILTHFRSLDRGAIVALGLCAVLATTLLISWPALEGPFLFDDFPNLEQLAALNGSTDWDSLANFAAQYRSQPGRPLSMLSFVLNDNNWPSSPRSFKYTNLMLHLFAGVLVFGLGRALARLRIDPERSSAVAFLLCAAWLIHPMQLSTSMLVVQRMTQLSAIFTFAGLWAYVSLANRAKTPLAAVSAVVALGIGTILATLSKETGALAPLLAAVVNYSHLADRLAHKQPLTRRILQWGTLLPVAALAAAIALQWDGVSAYRGREFTMGERLLSETRALSDYLFRILIPSLRGGGIYHDDFAVSRDLISPWTTTVATLFMSSLILAGLWARRRWPVFSFAVLWFFAGHLLESTIFPLELYFEHRNYLPMVGILFALSYFVVTAPRRLLPTTATLATLWLLFGTWLTYVQAPIWGNRNALVSVWAIEHPNSPRATQEYSAYLYRHGRFAEAGNTLLDAYSRGVRGSDFPLQALLLSCMTRDMGMASHARDLLFDSLASSEYNRATPVTLRKLRMQVQTESCPAIITEKEWLGLTDVLLANPKFNQGEVAAYIRLERAYLFEHRRNLNATMTELEKAWAQNPTPELAQLTAATLLSAGLYDEAEHWAQLALHHQVRGIRGMFSKDEVISTQLLEIIRVARNPAQTKGK